MGGDFLAIPEKDHFFTSRVIHNGAASARNTASKLVPATTALTGNPTLGNDGQTCGLRESANDERLHRQLKKRSVELGHLGGGGGGAAQQRPSGGFMPSRPIYISWIMERPSPWPDKGAGRRGRQRVMRDWP